MNDTQPSFQRGDKICHSTNWIDIVKFFGLNFALHALTVMPRPGANIVDMAVTSLCAIVMPGSGVQRAMEVLNRLVFLWGGELERALRAGALCMLVPAGCALIAAGDAGHQAAAAGGVAPPQDSVLVGFDATKLEQVNPLTTIVHGQYPADVRRLYTKNELPVWAENGAAARLEYTLVAVPASFNAMSLRATDGKQASLLKRIWDKLRGRPGASGASGGVAMPLALSCNYSLIKTGAALIQILYGSYELYMVSDEQIQRYGYAAYQFTVIPYVAMSILNLLASLSAPSYPARYIVHYRGAYNPMEWPIFIRDPTERRILAAEGIHPDMPNGAGLMRLLEEAEEADMRAREIYPQNWWNEEERAAVERMVGGAVGYVYGDFCPPKNEVMKKIRRLAGNPRLQMNMSPEINSIRELLYKWMKVIIESSPAAGDSRIPGLNPINATIEQVQSITADDERNATMKRFLSVLAGGSFTSYLGVIPKTTFALLAIAGMVAPYVVMGVLTRFDKGESKALQRAFIMVWITCGQFGSTLSLLLHHNNEHGAAIRRVLRRSRVLAAYVVVGAGAAMVLFPSVAGFYTVAKMILNERTCSRV